MRATEGQKFYYGMRLYRPRDTEETRRYIEQIRSTPIPPAD
ncbi:hypothetical protein AB0H20_13535 [Nocardia fluminea]